MNRSWEFDLSEVHFKRQLNDPVIRGCAHVARGCADRRASAAKGAVREVYVWIGPLRVVEQVKEFAPELKVEVFVGWQRIEILDQAGVHIP